MTKSPAQRWRGVYVKGSEMKGEDRIFPGVWYRWLLSGFIKVWCTEIGAGAGMDRIRQKKRTKKKVKLKLK